MAEYLAPGVYVEEVDSGVTPMEGVSTSTAGFIGLAQRGPVVGSPVLLTSFADYKRKFGGYLSDDLGANRFLPNCVEQFFTNGGSSCYVMRVIPKEAERASGKLQEEVTVGDKTELADRVSVKAVDLGSWGNSIRVTITPSSKTRMAATKVEDKDQKTIKNKLGIKNAGGFRAGDLVLFKSEVEETTTDESGTSTTETLSYEKYCKVQEVSGGAVTLAKELKDEELGEGDNRTLKRITLEVCTADVQVTADGMEEIYTGVSLNPDSPDNVNTLMEKSKIVEMTVTPNTQSGETEEKDVLKMLGAAEEQEQVVIALSGGSDGGEVTADTYLGEDNGPGRRTGIEAFREISDVSIMAVPGVTDQDVQAALIAHCENLASRFAVLDAPEDAVDVEALNMFKGTYDTSYAALYAPWVKVYDSLLQRPVFMPPSGSVCGIYARTDIQRGVFKAPANEIVRGCTGLSVTYNEAEQGKLNPNGVNLIRALPGQGIRVWGARTCSSNGSWKYVNVRRLFIFLEESIKKNINWAVFEPNDEGLWGRVKSTISMFLETQRRSGALMGSTADEAYYVDVSRNTMSEDDILNGRLICEIGVAPVRPAEFVIFRISQKTQSEA